MNDQKPFLVPLIEPAQVWVGLTADAQAGAIRLMANLASNLVARHQESTPRSSSHAATTRPPKIRTEHLDAEP